MSGRWIDTEGKQKVWMWERVLFDGKQIRPDNEGDWIIVKYNPFKQKSYIILYEVWEGLQRLNEIRNREVNVHLHKIDQLDKENTAIRNLVLGKEYFE